MTITKLSVLLFFLQVMGAEAQSSQFFTAKKMKSDLTAFVNASKPNRTVGTLGHQAAAEYLKNRMDELAKQGGGHVYQHSFLPDTEFAVTNYFNDFNTQIEGKVLPTDPEYKKWKNFTNGAISFVSGFEKTMGQNLILEFKGSKFPNEVIYVGAHYDTITHDHQTMKFTPDLPNEGADDNASGLMALLSLGEELAAHPPQRTVRLVAFDFEEIFFLGSYALAKDLKAGKISWSKPGEKNLGFFVFEMIGWSKTPLANRPTMKIYARKNNSKDLRLAKVYMDAAKESQTKAILLENGFDRSDNWSFWQLDYASICISQDWEKDFDEENYHTSHDSVANLNYDYLADIAQTTARAVESLASKGL